VLTPKFTFIAVVVPVKSRASIPPVVVSIIVSVPNAVLATKEYVSLPFKPTRVSLPFKPRRVLLSLLPVIMLLPALPVPLIAPVSVRVRFSTLVGKVVVTEAVRVSVMVVLIVEFAPNTALVGAVSCKVKLSSASFRLLLRMGC
jgi:hypothetical protein